MESYKEKLLQVEDLHVSFHTEERVTNALKGISFHVNKGEIVAIVGESGSGKTVTSLTSLQLLPGSAKVDSGRILFNNEGEQTDLTTASLSKIRDIRGNKISMIFQEPMTSLNPVMTCGSQVAESILHHQKNTREQARQKTIELFEKVKLPNPSSIYSRYPHELSGGQKQRVMIAMAVSCNPVLLIADEPTTALDVTVQKSIIELLKELQVQSGMSVLYITHDLGLVKEIADRVIVMYRGKIVEENGVAEIFTSPHEQYTKALLSCHPGPENKGRRLPVVDDFLKGLAMDSLVVGNSRTPESMISKGEPDEGFLQVQNLIVTFPLKKNIFGKTISEFIAVNDVSFTVSTGETLGLVGESGCGKTTLGRALIRLIEPQSGKIFLNGKDLLNISEKKLRDIRKDIQIVFQDPYGSLNPRITIGEAIKEPMTVHHIERSARQRKEKVVDLLERVGLSGDHYHRYPHEFSGGQRQRICIARALTLNPDFLICDESVSALDVSVQAQVLNLLTDLKNEFGFTSIFISHDLSVVHYISDRIMVMQSGKIVETGTADEIFFNPREPYTMQLIEAIPGRG